MNNNGLIILTIHLRYESFKDSLKLWIAPIFALFLGQLRDYRFGDDYSNRYGNWIRSHNYTRQEISKYFKGYDIEFKKLRNQTQVNIICVLDRDRKDDILPYIALFIGACMIWGSV